MEENKKNLNDKELDAKAINDSIAKFYKSKGINATENTTSSNERSVETKIPNPTKIPDNSFNSEEIQKKMMTENDPDLMIASEIVPLPSKGLFYENKMKEIEIQYLTSSDEDLLTTPSFIEDGSVINRLLERKIVDKNIKVRNLLSGDRSALILFLRTSSYGNYYNVSVTDPRNGKSFDAEVDLTKLKYKELKELPDESGEFTVEIPNRKKTVKFKLLTSGEEELIMKNADARKEAYGLEYSEFNTLRLKASIQEIGGNRDRTYIDRFVDAMPAGDAYTIRKKILEVSPEIEMKYEFKAHDGFKFEAPLSMGIDFFFPSH